MLHGETHINVQSFVHLEKQLRLLILWKEGGLHGVDVGPDEVRLLEPPGPDQFVLLLGPGSRHHSVVRVQAEVGTIIRETKMRQYKLLK